VSAAPNRLTDPKRLAALRETGLMDSSAEEAFDRLTRLAVKLLHAPVSLVSLVDDRRQFFKSAAGLVEPWVTARETPLTHSFCQHVVTTGKPFIVENAPEHAVVRDNLAIPDLGVIAYAGVPLVTDDGETIGSFCAIDTQARVWTAEEIEVIESLAATAMTELRLRQTVAELKRTAELKDQLIGLVSHEIRTPLGGILGTLRLIEMDLDPAADNQLMRMALSSAERLLRLTNDLLSLEQIESGKFLIEPKPESAAGVLQIASDTMSAAAAEKQIILTVEPNTLRVIADSDRIVQVLTNLIGNAIKFSPDGSTITLAAEPHASMVRFVVRDQGRGIPMDKIEHVFQRFVQVEVADKHEKGGAGLGLAISRAIVEQHGGKIWIESESGRGSSFFFTLPQG
jgi:signal transduction histidine kinase